MPFAESAAEIRENLERFNLESPNFRARTVQLLKQAQYWVYDEDPDLFCPSKFAAYTGMDFQGYERAVSGGAMDVCFDGNAARIRIERVLQSKFALDDSLALRLSDWGERLTGAEVFAGVDSGKWKFVWLRNSHK